MVSFQTRGRLLLFLGTAVFNNLTFDKGELDKEKFQSCAYIERKSPEDSETELILDSCQ